MFVHPALERSRHVPSPVMAKGDRVIRAGETEALSCAPRGHGYLSLEFIDVEWGLLMFIIDVYSW